MLILRPIFGRAGRPGGGPLVNRWAALAIPVLVFLLVCFLAPLVIMAVRSVTDLPTGSEGDPLAELPTVLRRRGQPARARQHVLDRRSLDARLPR